MRLIIMRHAKSDWASGATSDHARPLNARGEASAKAMGDWLQDRNLSPDLVLCSSAVRTRQTLAHLGVDALTRFEDRLYHASAATMLDSVEGAEGDTVLIIGHNPGIADFATRMVTSRPEHPRFRDFPTCATLVVQIDEPEWASVDFGMGTAEAFAVPREVIAAKEKAGN